MMNEEKTTKNRIDVLDSFRFIAIISVMLYHYYSRWGQSENSLSLYPYVDKYNLFRLGYLGVNFFFIISGFVITYTLYGTDTIILFWKKRLLRLMPAMALCSLITLLVSRSIDTENVFPAGHHVINLFYSITFIEPKLLDWIFTRWGLHGKYMNGSYWSLWLEIQFYFIASSIYFINKKYFIRSISIVIISLYVINKLFLNTQGGNIFHVSVSAYAVEQYNFWIENIFSISGYLLWFLIGVLFFQIYSRKHDKYTLLTLVAVIAVQLYDCIHWDVRIAFLIMIFLFLLFILKSGYLSFLSHKFFTAVGLVSYSLYLIHENIGVILINKYARVFGDYNYLFPVVIIVVLIGFSYLSYKYFEKPIGKYFSKLL